jgi:hypothetical protein
MPKKFFVTIVILALIYMAFYVYHRYWQIKDTSTLAPEQYQQKYAK